jgi:hypothetical protein
VDKAEVIQRAEVIARALGAGQSLGAVVEAVEQAVEEEEQEKGDTDVSTSPHVQQQPRKAAGGHQFATRGGATV